VNRKIFAENLRLLYAALSRQDSLDTDNAQSPARYLYSLLIAPIVPDLQSAKISTLLIALESGLQAVPFSALHDGQAFFGESFAFSLTPSLSLMPLTAPSKNNGSDVSLGASVFEGLAPLPLTPQEISKVVDARGNQYLNHAFSPQVLMQKVADSNVRRLHLATHAEFLPGGPSKARLFTGTGAMNLTAFSELRRKSGEPLLDLISLSACRTALGDPESELGFAGLALQAGARSAVGSLWYIDDVATSALFVLFYRYLNQGYPKAEALQATRQAFTSGQVHLEGDKLVGPGKQVLIQELNRVQQRRVADGLRHPFFWAGITLIGSPL
jgi:CHAT domain-containing protein